MEPAAGPSVEKPVVDNGKQKEPASLVDLLMSTVTDSTAKAKLASKEAKTYLSRLTSMSLPELLQEPNNLASEASQLTNSLTSLCHNEYSTFLSLHDTSTKLASTFSSFSESLSSLVTTSLPNLDTQARSFTADTKDILASRRKVMLLLEQHDNLIDILEIPQLLETCIRNGYYQEAMDLSNHTSNLSHRFPSSPVIQDIQVEVQHGMDHMVILLLSLLREPAKLPALFKATSFLRKMQVLDEVQLAMTFVTSRLHVLEGILNSIEKDRGDSDDVARYVRKYVDAWREGVYDFHTQYRTIFLDRLQSSFSLTPLSDEDQMLLSDLWFRLSQFTHHTLTLLLSTLQVKLSKIRDNNSLSSIHTQLIYCCNSFGRIGMDFELLLPPYFEHAVTTNFELGIIQATDAFLKLIEDSKRYNRDLEKWLISPASSSSPPLPEHNNGTPYAPPTILVSYPALATYINGILTTFNNLRLLAIESLRLSLPPILDFQLARASQAFFEFTAPLLESFRKQIAANSVSDVQDERGVAAARKEAIVVAAGKNFIHVLIPFVRRALVEGVYTEQRKDKPMNGLVGDLEQSLEKWKGLLDEDACAEEEGEDDDEDEDEEEREGGYQNEVLSNEDGKAS